jgi:hypothetical protein
VNLVAQQAGLFILQRPGSSLNERHRLRPAHVSRVEMFNVEAGTLNDIGNRSVEMASAGTALPQRLWRGNFECPPQSFTMQSPNAKAP